jgi:uncharacterized membrane protein
MSRLTPYQLHRCPLTALMLLFAAGVCALLQQAMVNTKKLCAVILDTLGREIMVSCIVIVIVIIIVIIVIIVSSW